MIFLEIVRYELAHRARSASTWIYAALLLALTFMMAHTFEPAGAVHLNAPEHVAFAMLLVGAVFGLPITAGLFGDAAVRDVEAEMDPMLFTAPLGKAEYLLGRFVAAFLVNAVVLLALPLGFALPGLMGRLDPESIGPFRIAAYAQPFGLFVLPNMAFAGAMLFATGVLSRRLLPVFLAAGPLLFATVFTMGMAGDASHPTLSVIGPLGYHALAELTEYWTAADRNERLVGLTSALAANRLVWLVSAGLVLALLHRVFRFAYPDGGRRRGGPRSGVGHVSEERLGPVAMPRVAGLFRSGTAAQQTLAVAREAFLEVAASRWFVAALFACVGLTVLWGQNVDETVFDSRTWPVTFLVAEEVLSGRVQPLVFLLIAVYAGELVWSERDARSAEITDAMPVPEGAALAGRFLALLAMILLILAAITSGGILIQVLHGYLRFELGLYAAIVFGLDFAGYVLFAALAVAIHVVVDHKHLGHLAVLLALVGTAAAGRIGIEHNLLIYGRDPGWTYSDMNGFGPFLAPFVWFKLYWGAWALLLGVLATLAWVRGRESGTRARWRSARARLRGAVARTATVALVLIVFLGGFVFYNTNILNAHRAGENVGAEQAAYERHFGAHEGLPQPTLVRADLRVEIYPDAPAVDICGTYELVNQTGEPLHVLHVVTHADVEVRALSTDHAAEPAHLDDATGYFVFQFDRPLQPGSTAQLAFEVSFRPRGFRNRGNPTEVGANGAYFNRRWLPFIGYQPLFELSDDEMRHGFGLEPARPMPTADNHEARRRRWPVRNEDLVDVEMVIGTAADQIAITPGALIREWTEDGRRWFRYATTSPTAFGAAVVSGKYEVVEDHWNGVSLSILHHPSHDRNTQRILAAMKASLEHYSAWFGPYPDRELRVVEVPRYGGFGHAHPHTVAFTEDVFIGRARDGEFDMTFYGTAHEIAHTWWGGLVRGAGVRGQQFLSEALANYSAMAVVERTFGPEAARRVYDYQMDRYLRRRAAFATDVPVVDVVEHPHIAYGKGSVALYLLRDHIGEDALHGALRRYFERYVGAGAPYPTSRDLIAELRASTPAAHQGLLADLFETVTLWDLRTDRASVEPVGADEFLVTLEITARKLRADDVGSETEVEMDDFIEIGVFGVPPERGGPGEQLLHLERHRIRSGAQTLQITVPRAPARAGIDPFGRWIDRERENNVVAVQSGM